MPLFRVMARMDVSFIVTGAGGLWNVYQGTHPRCAGVHSRPVQTLPDNICTCPLDLPASGCHPVVMTTVLELPVATPGYQSLNRPLDFTPAAAAKARELISEEGNPALKLRVYIQGGGCSGFQYGFEFDEQEAEDDLQVKTDGVSLLIDPLSLQYLMGATVDYVENLNGAPSPPVAAGHRSRCD